MLLSFFVAFAAINTGLPVVLSGLISHYFSPTTQQYQLIKAFSLLTLGMFLSSLATLNFSLAFLIGVFAAPLTYVQPLSGRPLISNLLGLLTSVFAPSSVVLAGAFWWGFDIGEFLEEAAFGWDILRMHTPVVIWCVWWPAWLVGAILVSGRPREDSK
jgi:glycosylphosphatidylinositol transamidase